MLYPSYQTDKIFNPGSRGPYVGYSNQVDRESQLKNMFHPLQNVHKTNMFLVVILIYIKMKIIIIT